jgi:Kef-type K+ transport system membrane component KefB
VPSAAIDPGSFLAVVVVAALAGTLATIATSKGVLVPTVVAELVLGVVIGPQVLGLEVSELTGFMANLGLGMLFFFAGYEIDLRRIAGRPLRLAVVGWAMSLALAYTIGGVLAWAGIVLSLLYTGSALATTAIGTLIPVLSDSGELRTRLGTYLLAAGAAGEFGPILLLTLILSTQTAIHNALILIGFIVLAVAVALAAVRSSSPTLRLFEQTIEKSSVRWILVLVFALALVALELGLDLLLGGFAAGVITRQLLSEREVPGFDSKLTAVAFGVFVTLLFLVVRGTPALLLYRDVLDRRERLSLAFFSATQLPLVLAITTLARETGHMHAGTATSLVCAAVLSTLVFPMLGLKLR